MSENHAIRFFNQEFVAISGGTLDGERARIISDVPMSYKLTSRIKVMLMRTLATHWVKIIQVERC